MTTHKILEAVLKWEGGFSDHPADKGGATNRGITLSTLAWWRKRPVTVEELQALSMKETLEIYHAQYVKAPGFDHPLIPDVIKAQLIDWGINSGPFVAIKHLQEVLGVIADGALGPQTLDALAQAPAVAVNNALVRARVLMIGRIIGRDLTQGRFALGWLQRALSFFQ